MRDLEGQLARLAGSLTVIGRPMGLATNIGGGVQAFFYEPYQGAIHGPQSFVIGLGRGTGSLVGGVVGGAMMSTSAIVSTYSEAMARGISSFGDETFLKMRAETHRRVKDAAREGFLSGTNHTPSYPLPTPSHTPHTFSHLLTPPHTFSYTLQPSLNALSCPMCCRHRGGGRGGDIRGGSRGYRSDHKAG